MTSMNHFKIRCQMIIQRWEPRNLICILLITTVNHAHKLGSFIEPWVEFEGKKKLSLFVLFVDLEHT